MIIDPTMTYLFFLINDTMNYDMCNWKNNFTIIEYHTYSWISDFHLECDEYRTGLLGSMSSLGYMLGSFTFSFHKRS